MPLAIKINPKDNVVVALHPIAKGTAVPVDGASVTAVEDIPQGHKMAIAPIHAGENVIKYGFPIGHATADAVPGTWMHTHNVKTNLSGEIEYSYHPNVHPLAPVAPETFMGYRRKDGRAATRNEIWIIPTVGCVNDCAKALVRDNQDLVTGSIDGLYTFTHPFGCSQTGHDHAQTRKLLAALARHPNAGAVLVLTPVESALPYLAQISQLLLMTVYPGRGGQVYLPGSNEKIAAAKSLLQGQGSNTVIQVDGGITPGTLPGAYAAGARSIVAGSAVFYGNIYQNVCALRSEKAKP